MWCCGGVRAGSYGAGVASQRSRRSDGDREAIARVVRNAVSILPQPTQTCVSWPTGPVGPSAAAVFQKNRPTKR